MTQKATEYTNGSSGEWQYNEDGHLVKESKVDSEGNSTLWEGTYDESGRLVKEVESNQYWGEVSVTVTEYVYSEDGKTVTKTERDGEGNVTDTETEDLSEEDADDMESEDEYQYDPETGVPISRTTVYENGGYRVVEFYPTGVVMRCTVYSEEDEVEAVYAYDEYGKEIMFEGTSFPSIKQTYQYDENGNKIKEYYERDTLMYVATYSEFVYYYYPDGLPEVQQNYYPDLGGIDRAQYNLGWENPLNAD